MKFAKFLRPSFLTEHFRWLLLFTPYVHLLAYTYLSILNFSLNYFMNLIKLIKYGNIETATKFSELKSILVLKIIILEVATGGGLLKKKTVLKNVAIFTGKQLCWSLHT